MPLQGNWMQEEPANGVAMATSSPTPVPNGSTSSTGASPTVFTPSFPSMQSHEGMAGLGCVAGPGGVAGLEGHTTKQSSWEVISRHSSGSTHLSLVQDDTSMAYLVPLWEALQHAFKSPWACVNGQKLALQKIIPDLLFVELPPQLLYRSGEDPGHDEACPSPPHPPLPDQESTGLSITSYYTLDLDEECVRQPAGANKAVSGVEGGALLVLNSNFLL